MSRRKARRIHRLVILFSISAALVLSVYLALFSELPAVRVIELSGFPEEYRQSVQDGADSFLQQKRLLVLSAGNFFLFDRTGLRKRLLSEMPELEKVHFGYQLSQKKITLTGVLRKPVALICRKDEALASENCFYSDSSGMLFSLRGQAQATGLRIDDEQALDFSLGKSYVPPEVFTFLDEFFKQSGGEPRFSGIVFGKDAFLANYIKVKTAAGWELLLGYKLRPKVLAEHLNRLLTQEVGEKSGQLEYIDLRFEDKAYYKLRS